MPGSPTLSPDGRRAVVAVGRLDLDADEYRSRLWLVETSGGQPPRPITDGARDSAPAWSPDGRWIAFLRAEPEGKPQLHLMPADLGEPRRLTTDEHHPLGAGAPRWSADSTRLAYTARVPEPGRYGTGEAKGAEKEPPRRITRLRYRLDDVGFVLDRRPHVFVLDPFADEPAPAQVTDGDFDDEDVSWTPDGGLLFTSDRDTPEDTTLYRDVYGSAPDGSGVRRVTSERHDASVPAASPEGGTVFFLATSDLGADGRDFVGRNPTLWAVPADGSQPPVPLTDTETHNVDAVGASLLVREDGVLLVNRARGAQELLRVPLTGGEPELVLGGERTVTGVAAAGGTVLATVADATSAGEVVVAERGGERVLTSFGAELAERGGLRPMEELTATAPDGYPVHGWVVRPDPAAHPGPRPVLLAIHGGPFAQYGYSLFDEAQVYAGAGHVVVLGNPRGALGYGEAHGRAIRHRMGTVDADDLLALLDAALDTDGVDRDRVGVMGGSYGGFMTTWLAAHAGERFRAAIVERALTAFDSFTGSSDIGYFFTEAYAGSDPAEVARQSPLSHVDRIALPTLVIHSEQDWRCPVEQAQRLFVGLRQRGVPAELLLFPGEGHELSRSGLPSHRVARFAAILEWWSHHLG
jgi:dipeptidyl aminopeptidase/acylaminoacyl peptidase